MFVIVAYDISTTTKAGEQRLRRVAKICLAFGQRVQKSVFECQLGARELNRMRSRLLKEIDPRKDNLRFYFISEVDRQRIEAHGQGRLWDFDGPLIIDGNQ
jgi:CRISPR-associated protein Cas2